MHNDKNNSSAFDTAGKIFGGIFDTVASIGQTVYEGGQKLYNTAVDDKELYNRAKAQNEENEKDMTESIEKIKRSFLCLQHDAGCLDDLRDRIIKRFAKIDTAFQHNSSKTNIGYPQKAVDCT